MIEVERKYRLSPGDEQRILQILSASESRVAPALQRDQIYLSQSESFKDFKPDQPVLRIRQSDETTLLTYKRRINNEGDRIEHEIEINSPTAAHLLVLELGYHLVTEVVKERSVYLHGGITVAIDHVRTLGTFIEFELLCGSEDQVAAAQHKLKAFAHELGIPESQYESRKYDQLVSVLP